jgi:ribosomal protein S18 acetylase RimI-like enzyme
VRVPTVRVRDAVLADLDVPIVEGADREYREQLTHHLVASAGGTGALIVAEVGGEVVGRAFVERWGDPPAAWLGGLIVCESHRRQGVGAALVRYAEVRASELGYDEVRLSVAKDNPGAQALYEKLGYETVGEDLSSGLVRADGTVVHPVEQVWVMSRKVERRS